MSTKPKHDRARPGLVSALMLLCFTPSLHAGPVGASAFAEGGQTLFIDTAGAVTEVPDDGAAAEETIGDVIADVNAAVTLDLNLKALFIDHQTGKVLRTIHRNQDIDIGGAFTSLKTLLGRNCTSKIKGRTVTANLVFTGVVSMTKQLQHTFTGDPALKECDLSFYGWRKTIPADFPLGSETVKVNVRISGFNVTDNVARRTVEVVQ